MKPILIHKTKLPIFDNYDESIISKSIEDSENGYQIFICSHNNRRLPNQKDLEVFKFIIELGAPTEGIMWALNKTIKDYPIFKNDCSAFFDSLETLSSTNIQISRNRTVKSINLISSLRLYTSTQDPKHAFSFDQIEPTILI